MRYGTRCGVCGELGLRRAREERCQGSCQKNPWRLSHEKGLSWCDGQKVTHSRRVNCGLRVSCSRVQHRDFDKAQFRAPSSVDLGQACHIFSYSSSSRQSSYHHHLRESSIITMYNNGKQRCRPSIGASLDRLEQSCHRPHRLSPLATGKLKHTAVDTSDTRFSHVFHNVPSHDRPQASEARTTHTHKTTRLEVEPAAAASLQMAARTTRQAERCGLLLLNLLL